MINSAKRFVKALFNGLPQPFLHGDVKETIEVRRWKNYAKFKEGLILLASKLYFPGDPMLSTEFISETVAEKPKPIKVKAEPPESNSYHRPSYNQNSNSAVRNYESSAPKPKRSCFACGDSSHFVKDCPKLNGIAARHESVRKVQTALSKPEEESDMTEEDRTDLAELLAKICLGEEAKFVEAKFETEAGANLRETGLLPSDVENAVVAHGPGIEFPDFVEGEAPPELFQVVESSESEDVDLIGLYNMKELPESGAERLRFDASFLDELSEISSINGVSKPRINLLLRSTKKDSVIVD